MLVTNTNCWVHFCKLSFWQIITWPIDSRQPDSPSFFRKFQSFSVCIFSYTRQTKIPDFTVFLCLSLHLCITQEVTILQTQFKTHVVSVWLCYAVRWMFTNTLIYKFQPTNMAGNKNDVIFFLGAGTLYYLNFKTP